MVRQLKAWMLRNGIPLTQKLKKKTGNISYSRAKLISYLDAILDFVNDEPDERKKDVRKLEKTDINFRENPIKNFRILNFTRIPQIEIREEVKKGIYLNLQGGGDSHCNKGDICHESVVKIFGRKIS